jgi:hypothetical protein
MTLHVSSSVSTTVAAATLGILNNTTTSSPIPPEAISASTVGQTILPTSAEATPIFLETKAAQGIAGAFVWVALFLTCQQVSYNLFTSVRKSEKSGLDVFVRDL